MLTEHALRDLVSKNTGAVSAKIHYESEYDRCVIVWTFEDRRSTHMRVSFTALEDSYEEVLLVAGIEQVKMQLRQLDKGVPVSELGDIWISLEQDGEGQPVAYGFGEFMSNTEMSNTKRYSMEELQPYRDQIAEYLKEHPLTPADKEYSSPDESVEYLTVPLTDEERAALVEKINKEWTGG